MFIYIKNVQMMFIYLFVFIESKKKHNSRQNSPSVVFPPVAQYMVTHLKNVFLIFKKQQANYRLQAGRFYKRLAFVVCGSDIDS